MVDHMTSLDERQPPKDWWLENACRLGAFRLRQSQYLSANAWNHRTLCHNTPIETSSGKRGIRQPGDRDVVENVVAREAFGFSGKDP
jgi:hypothetical protein